MRIAACAFLLSTLATTLFGANGVFTNVDGIVLRLEFRTDSVVAGERIEGWMVVSNASQTGTVLKFAKGSEIRDTGIGDFVVTDQSGNVLPKAMWHTSSLALGMSDFPPGESQTFPGDLVWRYALTNPGSYLVRAIAQVPTTNSLAGEKMVIETPSLEISVTPRPEGSAPPSPFYTASQLALRPKGDPSPLRVTHPKPDPKPPVPRVGTQRTALPSNVQAGVNQTPTTRPDGAPAVEEKRPLARSRNLVYGFVILLVLAALGIFLRRLGQKGRRA